MGMCVVLVFDHINDSISTTPPFFVVVVVIISLLADM